MTGWRKRTITEMAKESGFIDADWNYTIIIPYLETFAKLVRKEEHDNWVELSADLIRTEREFNARLCEGQANDATEGEWDTCCLFLAKLIRNRGQA
jgi:hypothetical protein